MKSRSILTLLSLLLPLLSFAWRGDRVGTGGSSAVMMSDTMARNTMICIGVAAFIVLLYGVKYWKRKS